VGTAELDVLETADGEAERLNAGLINLTLMLASCDTGIWSMTFRSSMAIDFVLWIDIRCEKEWIVDLV